MGRPLYRTRRDENDRKSGSIVKSAIKNYKAEIGEFPISYVDLTRFGGLIDYVVSVGYFTFGLEVKMPGKERRLTSGEKTFPGLVLVVTTEEQVAEALDLAYSVAGGISNDLEDPRRRASSILARLQRKI